ncbi:MAG: response regulator [Defluviitaleaceae bacterium]|nr:response regulator [Defluviitaleaceae bacterium]
MKTDARKTIFLVDDSEVNLMTCKQVLSDIYTTYTFTSGKFMLRALERVMPDLILLDVKMPEMGGYEVLHHLKSNPVSSHIPVIFLTALNDEESELKGLSMGGTDYITKPFSPPLLRKRVELHLLLQSQKRELIELNKDLDETVRKRQDEVLELKNALLETMAELVESRDFTTGSHVIRTSRYVRTLVSSLKERGMYVDELNPLDERLVFQSSQLHDVGKIGISDTILLKPGPLTYEEFEQIKTHAQFGEKIINEIKKRVTDSSFLKYAAIFAISHHEKWDGSGYPYKLKGEEIPLLGRIMAIADVYDALVTERPYKEAMTHKQAINIVGDGAGKHFDPSLVGVFMEEHENFANIVNEFKAPLASHS